MPIRRSNIRKKITFNHDIAVGLAVRICGFTSKTRVRLPKWEIYKFIYIYIFFNSYAQLSSLRVLSSCIGYNDLKCCKTFWIDQSKKLVRVYLQIEKGAINALRIFEKNTDKIVFPVGLAVRICGSHPQGSGSSRGLGNLSIFQLIFSSY